MSTAPDAQCFRRSVGCFSVGPTVVRSLKRGRGEGREGSRSSTSSQLSRAVVGEVCCVFSGFRGLGKDLRSGSPWGSGHKGVRLMGSVRVLRDVRTRHEPVWIW